MKGNNKIIVKQVNKKAWIGGILPALYDWSMENTVMPVKFGASVEIHRKILNGLLGAVEGEVLELAAGSGNLASVLNRTVSYRGIDISLNLLKRANRRFLEAGFADYEFFCCRAEELPFDDLSFDCCICNLALNFFDDPVEVLNEASRVLRSGAVFFGSVPVPQRNTSGSRIRGRLLSENELSRIFNDSGFNFYPQSFRNGALMYFKAVKQ